MYDHGTVHWQPSPNAIYETARSDLRTVRQNAAIKNDRALAKAAGAQPKHQGKASQVAFLPAHLNGARCTSDVLRAAIKGISDGQASREVDTLYLYQYSPPFTRLAIAEAWRPRRFPLERPRHRR
jgi:hypothetical protein